MRDARRRHQVLDRPGVVTEHAALPDAEAPAFLDDDAAPFQQRGRRVDRLAAADAATRDYLRIIDAIVASGIGRNLSLKLTQLGLDVDRASAIDNLRKIFDRAEGFFVRIDMESSAYTDTTLDILRGRSDGHGITS